MNDGQTGEILNDSIEKIKGILSIIDKINTRVDGLEKRISEIEKKFKNKFENEKSNKFKDIIDSPKEMTSDEDKKEVIIIGIYRDNWNVIGIL